MRLDPNPKITIGLCVGLLTVVLGSLLIGAYPMTLAELGKVFSGAFTTGPKDTSHFLIFNIRLPRILLGSITGAGLAITGAAIQGLFRNPLADPTLIGVSSGAVLFAVVAIVFLTTALAPIAQWLQQATTTLAAFIGSILTTYLVYALAKTKQTVSVMTMLLAGIAISALASAVVGFMIFLSSEEQLRTITFWTLGSLSGATWLSL
ncbi:MAG: iron ABC transporter permease, partial [Bacteroidota bacterium]